MPVKLIAKEKSKKKVKEVPVADHYAYIVEKMASLKADLDAMKLTQKEYDDHRKFLLDKIPEGTPAGMPYEFDGITHKVVFNKQSTGRSFKAGAMKRLHEMLGDDVFYAICNVALKDVDQYVAPSEQDEIIEENYSGTRTCSIKFME